MRAEKKSSTDNVIAFRRPREGTESEALHREVPDTGLQQEAPPAMVLNAERGVINTGTVHGGQHVTTIGPVGHPDSGADHDG